MDLVPPYMATPGPVRALGFSSEIRRTVSRRFDKADSTTDELASRWPTPLSPPGFRERMRLRAPATAIRLLGAL